MANIRSTILHVSESDPSSSANLAWVPLLLDRPLPIYSPSTASKERAIRIKTSICLAPVVATCTRSLCLSGPFRNWSILASESSSGHAILASFCNASTYACMHGTMVGSVALADLTTRAISWWQRGVLDICHRYTPEICSSLTADLDRVPRREHVECSNFLHMVYEVV